MKFFHVDNNYTEIKNYSKLTSHLETCCEKYAQSKPDQSVPIILFENNIQQSMYWLFLIKIRKVVNVVKFN